MGFIGIVVGLLILSVMMIVHELGHYLTGRRLGFAIEEFSIFMGPVLFSKEKNGIKYSIKLFPIGASVRFAGEFDDDDQDKHPDHFFNRPRWARALVIGTGPALNLLSGVLAFFIMFVSFGYTLPVLDTVPADSQAAAAGLEAGQRIVRVNGKPVRTTLDYSGQVMFLPGDEPLAVQVRTTGGETNDLILQPAWRDAYRLGITIRRDEQQRIVIDAVEPDSNGGQPVLKAQDILLAANNVPVDDMAAFSAAVEASAGGPLEIRILRDGQEQTVTMRATLYHDLVDRGIYFTVGQSVGPAIGQAFQWSWSIVKVTVRSIGMMFSGSIRPQDTLSGPVGVVSMISDVVTQSQPLSEKIYQLLWMFALISVSLGFMNLLPIPPLDGNHLVLIVLETIRGRRLSARVQNLIGIVGIALIVMLALAGLLFDILRLAGR
ncbi:MAG: RIP metalloprotease RseP [Eubacteriales bacterium]|jgi:regulator of sigma E protease|nr:RIP metalloprotease RseP [Eubacteriales bacterium]